MSFRCRQEELDIRLAEMWLRNSCRSIACHTYSEHINCVKKDIKYSTMIGSVRSGVLQTTATVVAILPACLKSAMQETDISIFSTLRRRMMSIETSSRRNNNKAKTVKVLSLSTFYDSNVRTMLLGTLSILDPQFLHL